MKKEGQKSNYLTPEIEVIGINAQGIICLSDMSMTSVDNPFTNNDDEVIW